MNEYPWLCSTINTTDNNVVCNNEVNLIDSLTTDAYGTYGLKIVYYKISQNLQRDKIFGEDQLQIIERAFNVIMYTETIPPNVRTYHLQGIYGEDLLTCNIGKTAFNYWSTYGTESRNTPEIYESFQPRIGDIIYLEANDTFYEIRDVKYYNEPFGLTSHTYTLTLKVYKDTKLTIDIENPTLKNINDPIYKIATSGLYEQYNTNDILKTNNILDYDTLVASKNVNHMDVLFNPNKGYNELIDLNNNISSMLVPPNDKLQETNINNNQLLQDISATYKEIDDRTINIPEKLNILHNEISSTRNSISGIDIETINYTNV